jgi:serine/threonine-protein kinase
MMSVKDRYAAEERLGEGGMGVVQLCLDNQIGRRIAMKTMQPDRIGHAVAHKRFVREARIQGQLEHPAVVPVYDLGLEADGTMFFTMKRVRGLTLEDVIVGLIDGDSAITEAWTRRRLLNAFSRVCLAVDYCHERGVLHRDIKPANIMVGDFGEVYLLDWGLAKIWAAGHAERASIDAGEDPSAQGAVLGTPGYMSPEQVRGQESLGPASDVYGLGAILFELLTLQLLHPGDSIAELLEATKRPVEARPSVRAPDREVPPELEELCVRATHVSASKRIASARELSEAIDAFLDGQRDEELRREMGEAHAQRATEAMARAEAEPMQMVAHRKTAMREVGRALALDPQNQAALRTMLDVLTRAPKQIPPEVEQGMAEVERERLRSTGLAAAIAYASLFLYLPLFFWAGIESKPLVALFYIGAIVSGLICLSAWISQRPSENIPFSAMIVSNAMFSLAAAFFGPLVLMPAFVANNTAAYAFHFTDWRRWVSLVVGLLAVAIPLALEVFELITPMYSFTDAGMLIQPRAIGLGAYPTLIFLSIGSFAAVVTGGLLLARLRDELKTAEKRLFVYTWHLRQLLPESGGPAA